MAKVFLTNVDLAKNQLLQPVAEVLAAAPGTPAEGQFYYNSTDKTFYGRNDTVWLNLGSSITDGDKGDITVSASGATWTIDADAVTYSKIQNVVANNVFLGNNSGAGGIVDELTGTEATAMLDTFTSVLKGLAPASGGGTTNFLRADGTWTTPGGGFASFSVGADINVDQTVNSGDLVEFTSSGAIDTTVTKASTTVTVDFGINNASITNTHLAVMNANTVKANATAGSASPTDVALTTNQVLGRLAANIVGINIIDDDTFGTATASNIATSESIKAYVDASVLGGMTYKGGYNASTDTPSLDDGTPIAGILIGDTYTVTAAGTFFTIPVQIGDVIIAEIDSALVEADWTIVNKNIPDIVSASETEQGIIELATQAEVNTGTDTVRAVTPATLQSKLGVTGTLNSTLRYTAQIGDGASTNIVVTHSIGRQFLTAQVFQTGSPYAQIECDIEMDSTTQTSFTFNIAPTLNQYTVVIVG